HCPAVFFAWLAPRAAYFRPLRASLDAATRPQALGSIRLRLDVRSRAVLFESPIPRESRLRLPPVCLVGGGGKSFFPARRPPRDVFSPGASFASPTPVGTATRPRLTCPDSST